MKMSSLASYGMVSRAGGGGGGRQKRAARRKGPGASRPPQRGLRGGESRRATEARGGGRD